MNDQKHNRTKLNITLQQFEGLLDECNHETKLQVVGVIANGGRDEEGEDQVPMTIECINSLFTELSDDQRIEVIKSVIWTALSPNLFREKVEKTICSDKFRETIY
jgi:hypothetical protein